MPTLLNLAGIAYDPAQFDGVSLLPLIAGHHQDYFSTRPIISQSHPFWSVIRGNLHCPDITRSGNIQVFNIDDDPREHNPLYGYRAQQKLDVLINSLAGIAVREVPGTETLIAEEETLKQQLT